MGGAVLARSGAACASTCAQIVFLVGVNHVIQGGGRLGFHSCSPAGDGTRAPICNEMVARQAGAPDAPYGIVMAFIQFTRPAQMRWLDAADASCWGVTIWPERSGRGMKRGDVPPGLLHGLKATAKVNASFER